MLTIWGRLNSHNVKKAVWAAVESGVEWQRHDMGGKFGYTDAYLAMNPNRLVPTIEDSARPGWSLWETNAILRYIADAHAPQLWAGDVGARAQTDKWLDWQFTFADAQRDGFVQMVRRTPAERDTAAVERTVAATQKLMAIMEAELARQPWLSGEAFGIADIAMGAYAYTWVSLGFNQGAAVPHVRDWYARIRQRPGFAQYVAIPLT